MGTITELIDSNSLNDSELSRDDSAFTTATKAAAEKKKENDTKDDLELQQQPKQTKASTVVLDSSRDKIEEIIEPNLIKVKKIPNLQQLAFPDIPDQPYDVIILGSGPAGEKAAVTASQMGASVAIVEVKKSFGGPT